MSLTKKLTSKVCTIVLSGAGLLIVLSFPSSADDESTMIGDIAVETIAATPAKAGETTRITFSIENSGSDPVIVTGVRWPTGEPSRVVGFLGTSHSGTLGSLPVDAGELVRLDGKKTWIEIGPLKADLVPGAVVSARLVLGRFEAPLLVHVSPLPPKSAAAISTEYAEPEGFVLSLSRFFEASAPDWLQAVRC